jgi:hypothetical protein
VDEQNAKSQQTDAEKLWAKHSEIFGAVATLVKNHLTERGISLPSEPKARLALYESAIRKVVEARQLDTDTIEAVRLFCNCMAYYPFGPEPEELEPAIMGERKEFFAQLRKGDQLYEFILNQFEAGWDQESIVQQLAEQGFGEDEARPLVEAVYTKAVKVDQDQSAAESTGHFIIDVIHLAQDILRMRGLPAPPDCKGRADFLEPIVREVAEQLQSGISPQMVRWYAEHLALYPRIWGSVPHDPNAE